MKKQSLLAGSILCFAVAAMLAVIMLTGCKSTSFSYDPKTGKWKMSDNRLGMRTEAEITASIDTNGNKTIAIKAKSDANTEAIKAAAEGVATGITKGLKPVP